METKVSFKATMELEHAIHYFEALLATLKSGVIEVRSGADRVELKPAPVVEVEVEASCEDGKQEFELEISWAAAPDARSVGRKGKQSSVKKGARGKTGKAPAPAGDAPALKKAKRA